MVGCLLIGLVFGYLESQRAGNEPLRLFIAVGLLGAFTTFSAFGLETFVLLRSGEAAKALASVALQVVAGVALVWAGYSLTGPA